MRGRREVYGCGMSRRNRVGKSRGLEQLCKYPDRVSTAGATPVVTDAADSPLQWLYAALDFGAGNRIDAAQLSTGLRRLGQLLSSAQLLIACGGAVSAPLEALLLWCKAMQPVRTPLRSALTAVVQ